MENEIKTRLAEVILAEEHIKKAKQSLMQAIKALSDSPEENDLHFIRSKILFVLKKQDGRCSEKRISRWWREWNKLGRQTKDNAIELLVREGLIQIEYSAANRNRGQKMLVLKQEPI